MDMGMVEDLLQQVEVPAALMSPGGSSSATSAATAATGSEDESAGLRRGPWTVDEDLLLVNYVAAHGEGRWNALARAAGLRRTGKSCRLRWLNYLRPDVRRGNITAKEQLLILELHSRWGNRWSKIALHLPGRTDNEIKNYWRTRVQKHARQLRCDVNSRQFRDVVRHVWMPRLVERIQADDEAAYAAGAGAACGGAAVAPATTTRASAPPACQRLQSAHRAADYYYCAYSDDPAASALSPDSALHSALTTDASSSSFHGDGGAHHHSHTTPAATPANEGCGVDASRPTSSDGDDDGVLDASWSELLEAVNFGCFGDLDDSSNLWSLDDLCSLHMQVDVSPAATEAHWELATEASRSIGTAARACRT